MKRNNIYTALLSLSLLSLGACSLDLEPLTSPSSASYPSSMEEANFGLNAFYSSLTAYSEQAPRLNRDSERSAV